MINLSSPRYSAQNNNHLVSKIGFKTKNYVDNYEANQEKKEFQQTNLYPYKNIGKLVAQIPAKLRTNKRTGQVTNKIYKNENIAILLSSTVLLAPASSIYFKDFKQLSQSIYYYPQGLRKQFPKISKRIKVKISSINKKYFQQQNQQFQRFNIAILILQGQVLELANLDLNIKWNYRRENFCNNNSIKQIGYDLSNQSEKSKLITIQPEIVCQKDMFLYNKSSESQPLLNNSAVLLKQFINEEKRKQQLYFLGFQCNITNPNEFLLLNDIENTQQIFNQLIEDLGLQQKLKHLYKPSYKKLINLYQNNINPVNSNFSQQTNENLKYEFQINIRKQIQFLKEQNTQLKRQLAQKNNYIQQLESEYEKIYQIYQKSYKKQDQQKQKSISFSNSKLSFVNYEVNNLKDVIIKLEKQLAIKNKQLTYIKQTQMQQPGHIYNMKKKIHQDHQLIAQYQLPKSIHHQFSMKDLHYKNEFQNQDNPYFKNKQTMIFNKKARQFNTHAKESYQDNIAKIVSNIHSSASKRGLIKKQSLNQALTQPLSQKKTLNTKRQNVNSTNQLDHSFGSNCNNTMKQLSLMHEVQQMGDYNRASNSAKKLQNQNVEQKIGKNIYGGVKRYYNNANVNFQYPKDKTNEFNLNSIQPYSDIK